MESVSGVITNPDLVRDGFSLQHTDVHLTEVERLEETLLTIARDYGEPTTTTQEPRTEVWPISPVYTTEYTFKTFSETKHQAPWHTDSQYRKNPESFFLLACIENDVEGKGTNELIDGVAAARTLEEKDSESHEILSKDFPFRVPTVFTSNPQGDPEVIWEPIVSPGLIRYRRDTIEEGFRALGIKPTMEQSRALHVLENLFSEAEISRVHLVPGDLLIVDNHRMLHSRTAFSSLSRLLYRVRMS